MKENKRLAIKQFLDKDADKFLFPKGFRKIDDLINQGNNIGLNKVDYLIIEIHGSYYGVSFSGQNKQLVLTKNKLYAKKTNGLFNEMSYENCTLPFKHYKFDKQQTNQRLAMEILQLDDNLKVFRFDKPSNKYKEIENPTDACNHLNVLGAISFNRFYSIYELSEFEIYFDYLLPYYKLYKRNFFLEKIIAINPFKQMFLTINGEHRSYEIKKDRLGKRTKILPISRNR